MAKRTAAQKRAAMLGGNKAGGRTPEQKRAAMLRMATLGGVFAANPGLGAPAADGGGGPDILGGLKEVGMTTLKALSVPQATLYTSLAKAGGRDVSWKNLGGDFVTSEGGQTGGNAALNSMGVTNKWAQLGVSIVADPLWFVGGALVRAPTKAQAVAKAVNAGSDVKAGTAIVKLTGHTGEGAKTTQGARATVQPRQLGKEQLQIGSGTKSLRDPGKKLREMTEDLAEPAPPPRSMTVPGLPKSFPRVKNAIRMPAVPVRRGVKLQFIGRQKPTTGDLVSSRFFVVKSGKKYRIYDLGKKFDPDAGPPLVQKYAGKRIRRTPESIKGQLTPANSGTIVGKSYDNADEAISAAEDIARQAGHSGAARGKRQKGSWSVALRGEEKGGPPVDQRLRNADSSQGEGWVRVDPEDVPPTPTDVALGRATPDELARRKPDAEDMIDAEWEEMPEAVNSTAEALKKAGLPEDAQRLIDEYGNIQDLPTMLKRLREELTKIESREGQNYGIRVGAGKFKKILDTGISAERGLLGKGRKATAFRAGLVSMKPIEKVAHALRRSGSETAEGVTAAILRMADKHGMTELVGGKKVIKDADATALGVYRSARSVNAEMGDVIRDAFVKQGLWTDQHDDLVRLIDERNSYFQTVDNLKEDTRAATLEDAVKKLTKKRDAALKRLAKTDNATNANKLRKAEEQLAKAEDDLAKLKARGPYTKQGRKQADVLEDQKKRQEAILQGRQTGGYKYRRFKDPDTRLAERQWLDNPFHAVTEEEFVADMMKAGLDEDSAKSLQQLLASELENRGLTNFRESSFKHGQPEWNAFLLAGRREQDHIWAQVEEQIDELIRVSGISEDSQVGTLLRYGVNREDGSTFAGSPAGQMMLKGIAKFKGFLTFANPSHYTRNLAGDFVNSNVNGSMSHANPSSLFGAGFTRSKNSRLANAEVWAGAGKIDDEILAEIHVIGGKEYTGADLLALSRMVGLGRGYVGTDIALMAEAFEKARTRPGEMYKFMQRLNIKRENAQRMQTWMKHMHKGDDPITAGVKTLRVHFDYTQLTEFEKLMLRNVLLFYTWMKRNLILQFTGVVTRPGLYSMMGDLNNAREEIANEPEYYKHQMALPIPGFGSFNFGNPVGDLAKFELTLAGFRRDVLGAMTPPLRVPMELSTNQKFFTGGRIQDYQGEVTQSAAADFARMLGIPVGTLTSSKAGGEKGYGINPQLAYIISQTTGPQGGTVQSMSNPDYEGSRAAEALGRFLGISPQQDRKEQFARAAKYIKAKKKADATRTKGAQGGP